MAHSHAAEVLCRLEQSKVNENASMPEPSIKDGLHLRPVDGH